MREEQQQMLMAEEELLQELRSKANELFLREQGAESSGLYSQLIDLCRVHLSSTDRASDPDEFSKLRTSLCLALANRADASSKLRSLDEALRDCDEALAIDSSHFRALVCKGKILLSLSKYSAGLECFKSVASLDLQAMNQQNKSLQKTQLRLCSNSLKSLIFRHYSSTGHYPVISLRKDLIKEEIPSDAARISSLAPLCCHVAIGPSQDDAWSCMGPDVCPPRILDWLNVLKIESTNASGI